MSFSPCKLSEDLCPKSFAKLKLSMKVNSSPEPVLHASMLSQIFKVFLPGNLWSETLSSAISVTQIHVATGIWEKELICLICTIENTISLSLRGWNGLWWNGPNSSWKNKDNFSSCSCQDASCSLHHQTEWWLGCWNFANEKYCWWKHIKLLRCNLNKRLTGWWQYLTSVIAGIISPSRH